MGKNPAFQFYPNDWNRDMEEHSLEIQGAWIVLLCKLWWSETRGEATKSLYEWARVLREKNKKTEKILHFLQEKSVADIHFLDNQNITIISRRMVKDNKISLIRQEVGKLGGNPGLKKIEENRKKLVNQSPNQNNQSPSPTPTTKITNKAQAPDWLDHKLFNDFLEHRKKLRKPMTEKAKELFFSKLNKFKEQGFNPTELIETAIVSGWQTVYEPRDRNKIKEPETPKIITRENIGALYDN